MGKGKKKQQESDSEEIEDVMAWGKSKNNYYREEEDQYSNASEEEMEARQIYENQLHALNKDEFYEVAESEGQQSENLEDEEAAIDQKYIESEILWATQLAKLFEGINDEKKAFRKKIYDGYLLVLLCLKEFDIPHIEQHPLVSYLPYFRKAIKNIQQDIPALYEKSGILAAEHNASEEEQQQNEDDIQEQDGYEEDFDEEQEQQEQQDQSEQYPTTINKSTKKNKVQFDEEGIRIYQSIKQKKEDEKKQKKLENKQRREEELPKQKFKTVLESEGRLANQKMIKNKGLIKKRKKIDGNSRVKLREKYRKALIKRKAKGFVGVKQNPGRYYEGEEKVLMGKIGSRKLK